MATNLVMRTEIPPFLNECSKVRHSAAPSRPSCQNAGACLTSILLRGYERQTSTTSRTSQCLHKQSLETFGRSKTCSNSLRGGQLKSGRSTSGRRKREARPDTAVKAQANVEEPIYEDGDLYEAPDEFGGEQPQKCVSHSSCHLFRLCKNLCNIAVKRCRVGPTLTRLSLAASLVVQ
jgi:hypothetical protein